MKEVFVLGFIIDPSCERFIFLSEDADIERICYLNPDDISLMGTFDIQKARRFPTQQEAVNQANLLRYHFRNFLHMQIFVKKVFVTSNNIETYRETQEIPCFSGSKYPK